MLTIIQNYKSDYRDLTTQHTDLKQKRNITKYIYVNLQLNMLLAILDGNHCPKLQNWLLCCYNSIKKFSPETNKFGLIFQLEHILGHFQKW